MWQVRNKNSTVPDGCRLTCRKPLSRGSAMLSDNVIGADRWAGARRSLVRAPAFDHNLRTCPPKSPEAVHYQTFDCSFLINCSNLSSPASNGTMCQKGFLRAAKNLLTIDIKAERSKLVTGQNRGKSFAIDQSDWDRNTCVRRLAPEQVF